MIYLLNSPIIFYVLVIKITGVFGSNMLAGGDLLCKNHPGYLHGGITSSIGMKVFLTVLESCKYK
jgi:hypothetical protein